MPFLPIRYSPSGPVITNTEGGSLIPGEGMQLRLVEGTTTVDTDADDWAAETDVELKYDPSTLIAPFLRPRLENPLATRRYRVTGAVDTVTTEATAVITAKVWVSYDEAATWGIVATCSYNQPYGQTKHNRIDMVMTLGSLMLSPVPDPAPASMMVRLTMRADVTGVNYSAPAGDGGTGFLQLTELL